MDTMQAAIKNYYNSLERTESYQMGNDGDFFGNFIDFRVMKWFMDNIKKNDTKVRNHARAMDVDYLKIIFLHLDCPRHGYHWASISSYGEKK